MMYSTALWSDEEGGVRGDLTQGPTPNDLEAAQQRKIHHVLRTVRVKPGDRLLEFGTGWGALAIEVSILATVVATFAPFLTSEQYRLPHLMAAKLIRSRSRWSRSSLLRNAFVRGAWKAGFECT